MARGENRGSPGAPAAPGGEQRGEFGADRRAERTPGGGGARRRPRSGHRGGARRELPVPAAALGGAGAPSPPPERRMSCGDAKDMEGSGDGGAGDGDGEGGLRCAVGPPQNPRQERRGAPWPSSGGAPQLQSFPQPPPSVPGVCFVLGSALSIPGVLPVPPPSCPHHPRGLSPALGIFFPCPLLHPGALPLPSMVTIWPQPYPQFFFLGGDTNKIPSHSHWMGNLAGEGWVPGQGRPEGCWSRMGPPGGARGGGRGSLQAGVPVPLGFFPACTPPSGHPTPSWGAQGPPGGVPGAQEHPENHTQPQKAVPQGSPHRAVHPKTLLWGGQHPHGSPSFMGRGSTEGAAAFCPPPPPAPLAIAENSRGLQLRPRPHEGLRI